MSVRMRHTREHTANRRSHHKATLVRTSTCPKCNVPQVRHRACANCGTYKGREVVDVTKKLAKTQAKQKARTEAAKESEKTADKPLELAQK